MPPHYDTFADFTYSYHYGDAYVPLHKAGRTVKDGMPAFRGLHSRRYDPITGGELGLQVVRILEAAGSSLAFAGAAVELESEAEVPVAAKANGNGNGHAHAHTNGNGNGNGHAETVVPAAGRKLVPA